MSHSRVRRIIGVGLFSTWVFAGCSTDSEDRSGVPTYEVSDFAVLSQDSDVFDIRDAIPAGGGGAWVLSSFEPHVLLLDEAGAVVTRFGASGEGPEDLRNPWYLTTESRGVGVYDPGARRLKVFDADGDLVSAVETPEPGGFVLNDYHASEFGEPLRVHRFDAGWVFETYSGQVARSSDLWSGRLIYVPDSGAPRDTLLSYSRLKDEQGQTGADLFAPVPLWTVCRDHIAVLNPANSVVTRFATEGVADSTRIPLTFQPLTDNAIETWVDRRLELAMLEQNIELDSVSAAAIRREALTEAMDEASEVEPPTKILCDEAGRVWIQGFSVDLDPHGYGRTWSVFDGEQQVASVQLPPRVWPLYLSNSQITALWRDEFDVERLVQLDNPMAGPKDDRRVPPDRLYPPGEPNEAMGRRAPDRRMVPASERRTNRLCQDPESRSLQDESHPRTLDLTPHPTVPGA